MQLFFAVMYLIAYWLWCWPQVVPKQKRAGCPYDLHSDQYSLHTLAVGSDPALRQADMVKFLLSACLDCHSCDYLIIFDRLLDPMRGGSNSQALERLEKLMQQLGLACSIPEFDVTWVKITINPPFIPEQLDGSACGVFMCAMMDCLR